MAQHGFGHVEIGDDTVAQRSDHRNAHRRFADHRLRLVTVSDYLHAAARQLAHRHTGRLVEDDSPIALKNNDIGSAKIDAHANAAGSSEKSHDCSSSTVLFPRGKERFHGFTAAAFNTTSLPVLPSPGMRRILPPPAM